MEKKCCICGKEFNEFGNNAQPVKDGTCCNACNSRFVLPARMLQQVNKFVSYEVARNSKERKKLNKDLMSKGFEIVGTNVSSPLNRIVYKNEENEEIVILCLV